MVFQFAKGHGTQNDFVILPDYDGELSIDAALVRQLCDRRVGIGADGLLRVVRSAKHPEGVRYAAEAEWFMDYRNADGSVAEMCGNGARVFVQYLRQHGLTSAHRLAIATRAGVKNTVLALDDEITVDMGPARLLGESIATVDGKPHPGMVVSTGNPHLVCITTQAIADFSLAIAPTLDPAIFPNGANLELVNVLSAELVRMRVYERGVGETRSCGTAACAAAAVALRSVGQHVGEVEVRFAGGRLRVAFTEQTSYLSGPAEIVAEGTWLRGYERT